MRENFSDKTVLVVQGSLLSGVDIETAFKAVGARVYLTGNVISAFNLLRRIRFDGAVIDQGLHNANFDLCSELRDFGVPYVCCSEPHQLQSASVRLGMAKRTILRLDEVISNRVEDGARHAATNWSAIGEATAAGSRSKWRLEGALPRPYPASIHDSRA
jgi:hypothetical protein